ncbi:MAG TPA: hypothetical protein VND65_01305 [Candidatus Binatia bacterium]|nr:hypothetical protein [Candidatus Binatia bacterium]
MSTSPNQSALDIDLWPKTKFETNMVTPTSILRRQAALLGEKTQQLVTAEVFTTVGGDYAAHFFRLVVPALDNYKYELFRIEHRADELYPLTGHFPNSTRRIEDQADFLDWLKEVFSAETTLKKIDSLMAQAKG